MSSGIDKLQELGAQKIYEQTHVSKEHVQAILHNSFEGLNKVLEMKHRSTISQKKTNKTIECLYTGGGLI